MDIEPNDTNLDPVVADTEVDLDDFSSEFFGTSKPAEDKTETKEDVTPDPVNKDDEDKADDQPEDNKTPDGDEDDSEDKPEEKPKKTNRYQERINELTAKAREAERALQALQAERAKQNEAPRQQNTPVVANDGPTPDDKNDDGSEKYPLGEFDPGYIRDMARHTIDTEWAARKQQEAQEQAQREEQVQREALNSQWTEKLSAVTEQHDDFLDKTLELENTFEGLDPQYSDYLVQSIKSLDHGPEVLYYFANNLDEAQKFVQMGPFQATLALGEINSMFKGQTRKATKVSEAPVPPQVNKGTRTRTSVAADTDDLDAFANVFFKKK